MKTLRKLFSGVLLAVCVSMLGIGGLFLNANTKTAHAIYTTDSTSYVKVGELYDEESGKMNSDNVDLLLKYITGDEDASVQTNLRATMEGLDNLSAAVTTSAEIRENVLSENVTTPKSSSQDVIVTLGGLDWQVVYLSKDNNGNDILTLWLSSSYQEAFLERSRIEGAFYGFLNGSLYSDWASNWRSHSTSVNYPSNMYGTSYIRAVTLNNGGTYATSTSASTTAEQSLDSAFARFTMEEAENSLTSFLVTPGDVSWQLLQSLPENNPSKSYLSPNDSLNDPTGVLEGDYYSTSFNYHSKEGYSAWANDYLWLPSMAETGYDSSNLGLWETSTTQRQNISSSTSGVGSVGSASGSAYPYSWLRSGYYNNAKYVISLHGSQRFDDISGSLAVRPALHLNLNSVALSATSGAEGTSNLALAHTAIENQTPTGEAVTPSPVIYFGDTQLVENQDYKITGYENNINEGVAKLTITAVEGSGYVGEKTFAFVIGEDLPDIANADIQYETQVEWAGSENTQDVVVSYNGTVLQEGVDYSMSISGTGTTANSYVSITIKGLVFFQNSQIVEYRITQRDFSKENRIEVSGLGSLV